VVSGFTATSKKEKDMSNKWLEENWCPYMQQACVHADRDFGIDTVTCDHALNEQCSHILYGVGDNQGGKTFCPDEMENRTAYTKAKAGASWLPEIDYDMLSAMIYFGKNIEEFLEQPITSNEWVEEFHLTEEEATQLRKEWLKKLMEE
jgi:hypothetical protein